MVESSLKGGEYSAPFTRILVWSIGGLISTSSSYKGVEYAAVESFFLLWRTPISNTAIARSLHPSYKRTEYVALSGWFMV